MSVSHAPRPYGDCSPSQRTPVAPQHVEIVTFAAPASTTTTPGPATVPWPQLAHRLTRHEQRTDKDGPGWSPAIYRHRRDEKTGGETDELLTRAKASIEAVTCAVADVDHAGLDDIGELVEHVRGLGLAAALYSTHSHSSVEPRVRLVIPFAEPVPAELWPRLWPSLNATIFLGLADRAASDASRMYYLPSTPGDETLIADSWEGAALDWSTLPLADVDDTPPELVVTTGQGPSSTVAPEDMPILERMFSGRDGDRLMRIWGGDASDYNGNDSSADMRLANALAFYCARDAARMERIARAGPYRPKWDERRGATTWLGYTIAKAIAACRETYNVPSVGCPTLDDEPSPVETIEETVARLERELGHARAVIAQQMTVIRAERTEKERLAEQVKGWRVVLSNKHLKPADRIAALPAIEHVLAARANGQDEIHIRYPGIVNGWGLPESTLGKSMDILTEPDGAPLAKRSEPGPAMTVETKRGPRSVTPPMTILRATVDGDLYAAVGSYDPELPQRGGRREPPPPCPNHPSAAEYVERTVPQCGDCRRPLEPARERWFTRRHFDGLTDGAPQTVGVRTLGRQNDGLTDGHDGAEQSERAATVLPIPIRPSRPTRYEQPTWLDDWPDQPDHVPALRAYDDVAFGGGES
jgi:hypothetical protein